MGMMAKGSARARERNETNKTSAASHSTPLYSTLLHSIPPFTPIHVPNSFVRNCAKGVNDYFNFNCLNGV